MVRIRKVYTRTGDAGNTALVGGQRVSKSDARVECMGSVDELNAILGIVRSHNAQLAPTPQQQALERLLQIFQQRLFDLGAQLATPNPEGTGGQLAIQGSDVTWLEEVIDSLNADLLPLNSFVLPGGGLLNANLHHARTVCRRAERQAVLLAGQTPLGDQVLPFLNRLSDALFVMSRWVAANANEDEWLWEPGLTLNHSWKPR